MARFTNQAQLRYGNSVANSNIAVGEILEVLSATKTAVKNTYSANEDVTYVVSIVNAGTVAVNGLTITDNLGTYVFDTANLTPLTYIDGSIKYYVNGVLQPTPTVKSDPPLVISGINIPAGGDVVIVYETQVNEFAPSDANSTITNTAMIAGNGITPITIEETIEADNEPILTITKSVSPVPVTENGTLTYTFVIDPVLSNLNVTFNGVAWTEGVNYTYDEATGLFTTVVGQITVPQATYTQDPVTNAWVVNPGISTLVVTGTV